MIGPVKGGVEGVMRDHSTFCWSFGTPPLTTITFVVTGPQQPGMNGTRKSNLTEVKKYN